MADDLLPDLLAALEQQLVSPQTRYVASAFDRLCQLGLDPAEAKNQMTLCLGDEMERVLRDHRGFDESAYRQCLASLPLGEP